jgi:hypothetical protein
MSGAASPEPVAADRKPGLGELGIQHGLAIATTGSRTSGEYLRIAAELLIVAKPRDGEMQQRVEPVNTAQRGGHRIQPGIAARNVDPLMTKNQLLLLGRIALFEVFRQHDAGPQQPEHRRQAHPSVGAPAAIAVMPHAAHRALKSDLLAYEVRHRDQ